MTKQATFPHTVDIRFADKVQSVPCRRFREPIGDTPVEFAVHRTGLRGYSVTVASCGLRFTPLVSHWKGAVCAIVEDMGPRQIVQAAREAIRIRMAGRSPADVLALIAQKTAEVSA